MKKTISVLLALMLCLALMAGCGAKPAQEPAKPAVTPEPAKPAETEAPAPEETEPAVEEPAPGAPLLGGWTAAESWEVSGETRAAFEKAAEGLLGVSYEPLACLGSQVVAGTNRAILCEAKAVAPDARPYYALVTLYEKTDGTAEILDIQTVTPNGEFDENAGSAAPLAGGWSVPEADDEGFAALEKAVEGLLGVGYTPVRVLGEQVVSGMNYCVLCQARVVAPDAAPYYCLVYVYRDLNGGASVTDVAELTAQGTR